MIHDEYFIAHSLSRKAHKEKYYATKRKTIIAQKRIRHIKYKGTKHIRRTNFLTRGTTSIHMKFKRAKALMAQEKSDEGKLCRIKF